MDAFGIQAISDVLGKVIDRVWPNQADADRAKLELFKMQQTGELAQLTSDTELAKGQLAVNTAEAGSEQLFVAGWRPFIGWICGMGLATQFLVGPLLTWLALLKGVDVVFPELDMGTLMTLLLGMLGLGGMRTAEKLQKMKGR